MSHAFSPPDILLILGELRAEVRQLGQDLTYLRALVEERLPAPCVPVPRAASPSAQPQLAVPSVPVPRAAASSVPVPRAAPSSPCAGAQQGSCAPVPRASAASAPVPRAPSSAGSFSVVGSQAGSTCAPVPRAPAVNSPPAFDQEAEPVFHSPGAASSSAAGLDSPSSYASTGLNVEASLTPPRLPPSAQISESERWQVCAGIGAFFARALAGGHRGSSGRHRNPLASRFYLVAKDCRGNTFNPPLLFPTFGAAERVVKVNGILGDSVFCGVPSICGRLAWWLLRLACSLLCCKMSEVSSLASVPRPEDLRFVCAGAGPNYEFPVGALLVGEEPSRRSVAIIFVSAAEDRVIVALLSLGSQDR